MHSSRMRTARSLPYRVSLSRGLCSRGVYVQGSLSGGSLSTVVSVPPPMNGMTNRCKIITLSQISFAGGNSFLRDLVYFLGQVRFVFRKRSISFVTFSITLYCTHKCKPLPHSCMTPGLCRTC